MLSRGDADLVERDPELPGLRVVLDADMFIGWLRCQVPEAGIRGGRSRYLRYKPGVSCLVAYQVECNSGPVVVTAKAYRIVASDKLGKAARLETRTSVLGPAAISSPELALIVTVAPHDLRLRALRRVAGSDRDELLEDLLPPTSEPSVLHVLSYKPERRFVGRLERADASAIVRVYAEKEYAAGAGWRLETQPHTVKCARTLGRHPRYPVVVTEWLEGEGGEAAFRNVNCARAIGETLACLHNEPGGAAWTRSTADEQGHLRGVARGLTDLVPKHAARVECMSGALSELLARGAGRHVVTHGDFAARQVILTRTGPALTDLDEVAAGHPASDIGSFLADVEFRVLAGELDAMTAERCISGFLAGYASVRFLPHGVDVYHAVHLLRLAPLPFRTRQPNWPDLLERVINRCEALPWNSVATGRPGEREPHARGDGSAKEGRTLDPAMPWLEAAVDIHHVSTLFSELPLDLQAGSVASARIRRHKQGRRCLIEYTLTGGERRRILGKTRAKGLDTRTSRLCQTLRATGFGERSADGIEVPPFLGVVPSLRMWLQGWEPGEPAAEGLRRGRAGLTQRLVEVILKLQRHGPLPSRVHTRADELNILSDRLDRLGNRHPRWRERLTRIVDGCTTLAGRLAESPMVPAHRDFYPEQILVDESRLILLDLDLYALAHPALDAGNCVGHIIELGLREHADSRVLEEAAVLMKEGMESRLPSGARAGLDVFTTLTLARLIEIDDRLQGRQQCVEPLLGLCEQRLSRAHALPPGRSCVSLSA